MFVYLCFSMAIRLELSAADLASGLALPLAAEEVRAGFPSPAEDCLEGSIDLNRVLVSHPAATFYARVAGDSMEEAGIGEGDLLVIDKLIEPQEGDIVVAFLDGEFTLKRFRRDGNGVWLEPANPDYPPIRIGAESDFRIWGVVTYNIRRQLRRR